MIMDIHIYDQAVDTLWIIMKTYPHHLKRTVSRDFRLFYGAKKVSSPSKSLDFVPGPFRILELAPFSDLVG